MGLFWATSSRIIAHLETLRLQWCELLFYQFRQSLQNMLWVNWLEWLVGIVTNHSSSLVLILFSVVANRTNRTNRTASPIGFCFVVRLDSIGVYFAKFAKFASLAQWFLLCGKIGAIQLSKSEQPILTFMKGIYEWFTLETSWNPATFWTAQASTCLCRRSSAGQGGRDGSTKNAITICRDLFAERAKDFGSNELREPPDCSILQERQSNGFSFNALGQGLVGTSGRRNIKLDSKDPVIFWNSHQLVPPPLFSYWILFLVAFCVESKKPNHH